TQQPGSIPVEILSQGDNWFIFHLLSAADLTSLKRANAHFSDDLLSSLLNEPIPGQGVFWSSVGGKPYPVSLRALSFEKMFSMRDRDYNQPAGRTYAQALRSTFSGMRPVGMTARVSEADNAGTLFPEEVETNDAGPVDVMANIERQAIEAFQGNADIKGKLESADGMPWYGVQQFLMDYLPEHLEDRRQFAYNLVPKAMNAVFGAQPAAWETFKNPTTGKTWIRVNK
ncbi:MAG TPA: ATPase, partial [Gammaproteobacteria bacterium]|nr:ATPase [Gammaproteobacteria bacterium]